MKRRLLKLSFGVVLCYPMTMLIAFFTGETPTVQNAMICLLGYVIGIYIEGEK